MKNILTIGLAMMLVAQPVTAFALGHYSGPVSFQFVDATHVKTLNELTFVDSSGVTWTVPQGAQSDGASIPRFAWTTFGPPFSGAWMNAALIHDYYCDVHMRPRDQVNRVFYDALLTSKVPKLTAQVMYTAVKLGAPHWNDQALVNTRISIKKTSGLNGTEGPNDWFTVTRPITAEEEFTSMKGAIESGNMSLEDIDQRIAQSETTVVTERLRGSSSRLKAYKDAVNAQ